ncbi:MAG TPA: cell division protein ZapE, partial [Sulfitobacter sp.]|nr:cell division protein ZapE [Sulfitobacter sp.]
GVGRGKSMLMDMFAANMGDVPTRRVHFHAFMQEIHSAMHEARKTGVDDAIAPVAAEVANSVKLLAFDEMQITDIT